MLHEFTLMVLAPQKAVVYNNIFLSPDIYVLLVTSTHRLLGQITRH